MSYEEGVKQYKREHIKHCKREVVKHCKKHDIANFLYNDMREYCIQEGIKFMDNINVEDILYFL